MMSPPQKNRHEPSRKEKCQKIGQAIAALEAGNYVFVTDRHDQLAMEFLGVADIHEILDWITVFLEEIKEMGPVACFVGQFVPRCYEPGHKDLLLFAYHWDSPSLGKRVYLKFGIKKLTAPDGTTHTYCHLDCHEDQPR